MSDSHQPGSPGVDLDALEGLRMLALCAFGSEVDEANGQFIKALAASYPSIVSELRALRARVAELEAATKPPMTLENVQLVLRAESAEALVKEREAELSACDVSEDELAAARDITRDYDEVRYRLVHLAGREEPGGDPIREFVTEIESRVELIESQLAAATQAARNLVARIDGDGGQKQDGESVRESCDRADGVVVRLQARVKELEAENARRKEHENAAILEMAKAREQRMDAEWRGTLNAWIVRDFEEGREGLVKRLWDKAKGQHNRITDLESQLAAAREGLQLVWSSRFAPADDADGRGMSYRVHGDVWERVRAILEVEKGESR